MAFECLYGPKDIMEMVPSLSALYRKESILDNVLLH